MHRVRLDSGFELEEAPSLGREIALNLGGAVHAFGVRFAVSSPCV